VRIIYSVYFVNLERMDINDLRAKLPRLKNDFEVVGASADADKAIAEIVTLKPDLVITGLYTKTMTGNALIGRIRKAGFNCEFIIYTDIHSHDDLREFFSNGGYDYWLRPLDAAKTEISLERLVCKLNKPLTHNVRDCHELSAL
jgi:response regulator of citrate/malate metabolism